MNIALIVAGGTGNRMGLDIPKQFVLVNNKPILIYTIEAFLKHPQIDDIYLVIHQDYLDEVNGWIKTYNLNKVKAVIKGGETRQISVFNGLKEMKRNGVKDDDIILIHDAARPLVNSTIISNNISTCQKYGAAVTSLGATDTILLSTKEDKLNDILNRDEIYLEQTPATFKFDIIYQAHQNVKDNQSTDDCGLVMNLGKDIHLVKGDRYNFKITTIEDLKLFELLKKKED